MKKSDRERLNRIADLGCIACYATGNPGTPCEIHHPRTGVGMGQRARHGSGIGLCPAHHRGTDHPRTPSIHLDKRRFESEIGTEAELLALTEKLLSGVEL